MIAIKRILVPTDFSDMSGVALKYGIEVAQAFGGQLYLLHVPGETGENFEAAFPFGPFENAARERPDTLLSPQETKQLRPTYAMRIGSPSDEIVRYAGGQDIDLIVMGTHGRSGVAHLVMGSVAEKVVRAAPCPVLMVRYRRPASVVQESHKTLSDHEGDALFPAG